MPPARTLTRGDVEAALASADHVLEGEMRIGGQEHFYLETNATIAVPKGAFICGILSATLSSIGEALHLSASYIIT